MINFGCNENLKEHNWFKVGLIFTNLIAYVAMLGFNALATFEDPNNKLFTYNTGSISDFFYIEITPAGWVFGVIWTTIFVWNLLWLLYALANIWRRTDDGELIYRRLNIFPSILFVFFIINNIAIIIWLFVWDGLNLGWALFLIILAVISVDVCVVIVARHAHYINDEIYRQKKKRALIDVIALQLTLNGLGVLATWLSLATNLNLAQFLTWVCGAKDQIGETIALVNILILVIVYFVVENFAWQRFLVYLFTPWIVVIIALAGSIDRNWMMYKNERTRILTLILAIIAVLLALAKIILSILYTTIWKRKLQKQVRVAGHSVEMNETKKSNEGI